MTSIQQEFHTELFSEEGDYHYDSSTDAYARTYLNENPMNDEYIEKVSKKRELLGVSQLTQNGLAQDNSSEICIHNLISEYIEKHLKDSKPELRKNRELMNISTYFKNLKNENIKEFNENKKSIDTKLLAKKSVDYMMKNYPLTMKYLE